MGDIDTMLQSIIITVLFSVLLTVDSSKAQDTLTPEDAVRIGLQNNYSIRIARNNSEIADNSRKFGRAVFLPSLSGSANYSLSTSGQETNSPFSFGDSDATGWEGQVSLNWTLFDGFRMFAENRRFNELALLGNYQSRSVIERDVVSILQAYYNVHQQEQLLTVFTESRDISEERLERERVRNQIGGASSTDLLNAQVSFNKDVTALIDRELQVEIARKNLNVLVGQDPASEFEVLNEIPVPVSDLDLPEIMNGIRNNNSDLQRARKNSAVAKQDITVARSEYFPNMSFGAGYSYSDRTVSSGRFPDDITTKSTDRSVSLSLSYNLFDGFRKNTAVQNARVELKNSDLALQQLENELTALAQEFYLTYIRSIQKVELEEQNILAARQNLQLQQERFNLGTVNSLEFRDAQVNLNIARADLISAQFQARIALLEIQRLMGEISIE